MQSKSNDKSVFSQAVFNQYNVILMGGMALLSLASNSAIPVLIAAGGEVFWMLSGARSERFRRWVADQERMRDEQIWRAQVDRVTVGLDAAEVERLRVVGNALMQVARAARERDHPQFTAAVTTKLEALLPAYATLASAMQRLVRLAGVGRTEALEGDIARLNRALADEADSTVRISLRQAIGQTQRRLKRVEQIETFRRDLSVKMSTFEASLEFEAAELRGGEPNEDILNGLDEMLAMARVNPNYEAEIASTLNERRMASGMFPIVPPSEGR